MSPDIFIPIAERSDLVLLIGEWGLKHASIQAGKWKRAGVNHSIDINVSGKHKGTNVNKISKAYLK